MGLSQCVQYQSLSDPSQHWLRPLFRLQYLQGVYRTRWSQSQRKLSDGNALGLSCNVQQAILINAAFPGPMIEANWGDTIQVTVNNQITGPEEGTSLHWHGFLQKQTPYYDGVPAVGQCPIAPNSSLTYSFHADLYGTSWYHSHYSAQYAAGISGPIVIHGPTQADYDIDIGPVMLSDWYHTTYYE